MTTAGPLHLRLMTEESQLNEVELRLQNLRCELRSKIGARKASRRPFTKYQAEFALRVYCLSGYNMDAAVTCLHNLCQKRQECLPDAEQRQELIESGFLQASSTLAAEMSEWATTPGSPCARAAQKAYLEYMVMQWVRTENVLHGHAPSTDMMRNYRSHLATTWERASSATSALEPFAADLPSHEIITLRGWAARFRQRWGGRIACIRLREPMAEDVALQKADRRIHKTRPQNLEIAIRWSHFVDLFLAAKRSQKEAHSTEVFTYKSWNAVPERVPEMDSIERPLRRQPRGSGRIISRRKFLTAKRLCTSTWTRLP